MDRDRAGEAPPLDGGAAPRLAVLDEPDHPTTDAPEPGSGGAAGPERAGSPGAGAAPTGPAAPADPAVHRVRDLPARARGAALAVAVALLTAPAAALAHFVPGWAATNDPALMGLRALDVGTARTPLLGQPSQSGLYADSIASVHHPGPLHLYLLAGPVRVLGPALGMPLVSAAIVGACLVVIAWVVFRLLGRRAALVAAAALSLVTFTTGAASLVNPVSSNIAGYPLLACTVLLWAVAAGDVRLLPLATVAVSFTAQQHLAVVPATIVLCAGGLTVGAVGWWRQGRRHDPAGRRELRRSAVAAGAVGLLLWAPVLAQQAFGDAGNLGEMLWFARHGNGETVGPTAGARQVVHALGLPPLLGRTDADGLLMLSTPAPLTWMTAAAVLGLVGVVTWRHRGDRARASLGVMVGVVVAAGLVNGSSVPEGLEKTRLAFYHWAFALAFVVLLVLGVAASELLVPARRLARATRRGPARAAVVAVVVAAVMGTGLTSPQLDRRQSTVGAAYASVPAGELDRAVDDLLDVRGRLGDHTLLVSRGEPAYAGIAAGVAVLAAQRGLDLRMPLSDRFFVHDDRLVDRDRLDGGVALVAVGIDDPATPDGGELIARVPLADPFPADAFARLVEAARGVDAVGYGPETEAALDDVDHPEARELTALQLASVVTAPETALADVHLLDLLIRAPLDAPAFDPDDLLAVRHALHALDGDDVAGRLVELRLYLLDLDETLVLAESFEVGTP